MTGLDYSGLTSVFGKYYKRLVAYSKRYVQSYDEAQDIVQECFLKLWERRNRLSDFSVPALLYTMVRNACLDSLKHRAAISNFEAGYFRSHATWDCVYDQDFLGTTEGSGLYSELYRVVRKEVSKLPQRCREVFVLSRFEGLSNHEIAERLGITDQAVHKHIDNAVRKLRRTIR